MQNDYCEMINENPTYAGLSLTNSLLPGLFNIYILMSDFSEYALFVDLEIDDALFIYRELSKILEQNPALD